MKSLKFAITGNYSSNDFHYIIKLARLSTFIEHSCTHAFFKFFSYHNLRSSAIVPNIWTSETAVWSKNLNAAQSSERCAESYWAITSLVFLNLLIHLAHDNHIAVKFFKFSFFTYSQISFDFDFFQHSFLNLIVSDCDSIEFRNEMLIRISRLCVLVEFRPFLRSLSNELKAWSHRLRVTLETFAEIVILST